MSSRQPHRKTRTGCQKCKQRKVRCGQERPICNNCERLGHHCSFLESNLFAPEASTTAPSRSASVIEPKPALASELSSRDPDVQDLELMHHYATSTCFTMTDRASLYPVWQVDVVKLAIKHPFLLRGLLSLASLHLHEESRTEADRRVYAQLASTHQDAALRGYQEQLKRIGEDNSGALLLFSAIIASISWAFLRHSAQDIFGLAYIEKVIGIFDLLIGAKAVMISGKQWIKPGDTAKIAVTPNTSHVMAWPNDATASLDALLLEVNNTSLTALQSIDPAPKGVLGTKHEIAAAYINAIQGIKKLYYCSAQHRPDISMVFAWPVIIDPLFIQLLKQQDMMSLVILAHFGAALHCLSDVWWAKELGTPLVQAVTQTINNEWLPYLHWPLAWTRIDHRYHSPALDAVGMDA